MSKITGLAWFFLVILVSAVLTERFVDPDEKELDDTERDIQSLHEIDNPFPAIRDYRVWRSVFDTPPKRTFCPRGFVHNPVTSGCIPSLGFLKGRRWTR